MGRIPWNKGKTLGKNPEHSKIMQGRRVSQKTEFKKGQTPWNKGLKGLQTSSMKGKHHTSEARLKMSEAIKKTFSNPEIRKKMSESHKGKSAWWNKGRHPSLEALKKQSEAHKGQHSSPGTEFKKGLVPWNKGKPMSVESKKKMSEALKGRISPMKGKHPSQETIEKNRLAHLGKPSWNKGKKGLQVSWNKGKPWSEETKQRMCSLTIEDMKNIAKGRGGECLSDKYVNSATNLKWKCKEGHEWQATPSNIKKGKWCPICLTRISEKICRGYFEALFNEKFPKSHPDWLKYSSGKKLELDGYCKKLGLAFEYQGEQHYFLSRFFNRTFNLEKIKEHDEFKKGRCAQNKVTLIQVPYNISYEQLGKWISEECKRRGVEVPVDYNKINYHNFDVYSSKNLEEMKNLATSLGGECISDKYILTTKKLKWKCDKGHIWEATPTSVKNQYWCPYCSGMIRLTLEKMKEIAQSHKGLCLSEKFVNRKTKLKWQCVNGHVWMSAPRNIVRGKWCPICAVEYRASLSRGNIEKMRVVAKSRGGECLSDTYNLSITPLIWRCKEGHEWKARPAGICAGKWCPFCAHTTKLTIEEMQKIARSRGGECLSQLYVNTDTNLKWKCKEGHEWQATPDNIKHGKWCPVCAIKRRKKV